MVPEFQISVTITARLAVRFAAAVFRTSVKIDFGTRSAWAETDFPEVVVFAEPYDSFFRHTKLFPYFNGLIVVLINCCPHLIERNLKPVFDEFKSPCKRLLFKIVTK